MINIEKLIERLKCPQIHSCPMDGEYPSCKACQKMSVEDIATALSTLQDENEKLRAESIMHHNAADNYFAELTEYRQERNEALAELEEVKRERDALIEAFVDYVTGGVPNPAIFCKNRCNKCVDMRSWCTGKDCKGFYPSVASGQKED